MNLYALNETPINGWAVCNGSGHAEMSLNAQGTSANVALGSGTAELELQATGDGTRRVLGSGSVTMELNASGEGLRWAMGAGLAQMVLYLEGEGTVTNTTAGIATMRLMVPLARGGLLRFGQGKASMTLNATADGRVANSHFGEGVARMELAASGNAKSAPGVKGKGRLDMWLYAGGDGYLITKNAGAATMSLEATGRGYTTQYAYGSGRAAMTLNVVRADSLAYQQVNGSGELTMELAAEARDRRIAILPSEFYPAPPRRTMSMERENRGVRVAREDRTAELMVA